MNNRQDRWDRRYVELARYIANWSKDPSTKVGAVLVRPNNTVASTGFNGFPPGWDDSPELYANRKYKYEHIVHAEINALSFVNFSAEGFTLYTSFPCCPNCMEAAGKAGVKRIVFPGIDYADRSPEWVVEWNRRIDESLEIARYYNIRIKRIDV